jgi:cell division septation protein DedD
VPPPVRPDTELADAAYWVQAISSPNRDTIEQAQRTLREHQLGTRIMTKEIGETTYFRLRLGPFAVREEAEKFLGWVMEIDGFGDSMIFVDYTTAVVAAQSR